MPWCSFDFSMSNNLHIALNTSDKKLVPQSVKIDVGISKMQTQHSTNVRDTVIASDDVISSTTANAYHVSSFYIVSMWVFPNLVIGNGPTIYKQILSKAFVTEVVINIGWFVFLCVLFFLTYFTILYISLYIGF